MAEIRKFGVGKMATACSGCGKKVLFHKEGKKVLCPNCREAAGLPMYNVEEVLLANSEEDFYGMYPPRDEEIEQGALVVGWIIEACGFGSFTFLFKKDGSVIIDTEHMGKEAVKAVMEKLIDEAELR